MLKFAYQIGVELALMKLAQPAKTIAELAAKGVSQGGARARFLEQLRKNLLFQGKVPKTIMQDIEREQSFPTRASALSSVLGDAYGL